jgi:hypothetical protein
MKVQAQRHDNLTRIAKRFQGIDVCMLITLSTDGPHHGKSLSHLPSDPHRMTCCA